MRPLNRSAGKPFRAGAYLKNSNLPSSDRQEQYGKRGVGRYNCSSASVLIKGMLAIQSAIGGGVTRYASLSGSFVASKPARRTTSTTSDQGARPKRASPETTRPSRTWSATNSHFTAHGLYGFLVRHSHAGSKCNPPTILTYSRCYR